ncbi:unnamed protein product [Phytophthora fragariaefolia]|uniref:Unnamed protein product n=1 Tax=Phytophthora fragariaefolia TaxID=1490495 RepID=A0A9W6XB63_9STRA|nr:unnamed protein product [Phytophthora fragariaefolia]
MLHRVQDSALHNAERLKLRKAQSSALRKVQGWGKGTKKIDHAIQQVSDVPQHRSPVSHNTIGSHSSDVTVTTLSTTPV